MLEDFLAVTCSPNILLIDKNAVSTYQLCTSVVAHATLSSSLLRFASVVLVFDIIPGMTISQF